MAIYPSFNDVVPKVGIFYIATGTYIAFWDDFKASCDKYFCTDAEKTYILFTDADSVPYTDADDTRIIKITHEPWPGITLHRFRLMLEHYDTWKDMDYVVFCNANMLFCTDLDAASIIREDRPLMACVHACANGAISVFSLDRNPNSTACCDTPTAYVCGGFQGGTTSAWKDACEEMDAAIRKDEETGVVALWHDESHWNKYCTVHPDRINLLGWPTVYVAPHPLVKAWLRDKSKFFDVNGFKGKS